jgi:hypothetical protein
MNMHSEQLGGGTGIPLNVATGDPDPNLLLLALSKAKSNDPSFFQFTVNTTLISNMSLSFAQSSNGNGFSTVAFSYSTNGGTSFTAAGSQTLSTGGNVLVTFSVPAGAEGQASVIMRLTFSGGSSNGTDLQTEIDNVQLNGTVATPEPATVVGGLLGICVICWHQRRWLIRSLRLRRA